MYYDWSLNRPFYRGAYCILDKQQALSTLFYCQIFLASKGGTHCNKPLWKKGLPYVFNLHKNVLCRLNYSYDIAVMDKTCKNVEFIEL